MDNKSIQNLDILSDELKQVEATHSDPVSRLLVVTLLHQIRKIRDEIEDIPTRIVERLCSTFVPKNKVNALPAVCHVVPKVKVRRECEPHFIADGSYFIYKLDSRQTLSFYPVFRTCLLPFSNLFTVSPTVMRASGERFQIQSGKKGYVWVGMEIPCEVDSLESVSFFIKGTDGVMPRCISVGSTGISLEYSPASALDQIPLMEPFDSQQMRPENLAVMSHFKDVLSKNEDGRLVYITDTLRDRDIFKRIAYPKAFQQIMECSHLDRLPDNTLWLMFDFGSDYEVPEDIEIIPNVVPVTNVNVNSATLTQSSPVAKLTKNDGSFFLSVLDTPLSQQKLGFNRNEDEFMVRDFDARTYNPDSLMNDVRNLYNRFVEDYHAFIEYHGLKDGELVRLLRETVNKIAKSVKTNIDGQNRFDEGVYAMRDIRLIGRTAPVKVAYLTTMGRKGNIPNFGSKMENKKDAGLEKEIPVLVSSSGGEDRANADRMYEMLRYHTLTADRLYTRMDVDAFLRMQLNLEFGADESKRISYEIYIGGAGGTSKLQRGLYIDIYFKDGKNFDKARSLALDRKLHQAIIDRSCISMPVIISLKDFS